MWRHINKLIKNFFIKEEFPSHMVFGERFSVTRRIKTDNIALIISIIALAIILWKI